MYIWRTICAGNGQTLVNWNGKWFLITNTSIIHIFLDTIFYCNIIILLFLYMERARACVCVSGRLHSYRKRLVTTCYTMNNFYFTFFNLYYIGIHETHPFFSQTIDEISFLLYYSPTILHSQWTVVLRFFFSVYFIIIIIFFFSHLCRRRIPYCIRARTTRRTRVSVCIERVAKLEFNW